MTTCVKIKLHLSEKQTQKTQKHNNNKKMYNEI